MAAEAEAAVLGQRRAAVETTLRETQEENDEFRRRILGLEQQLKEARGLAEGGEVAEARLRDKVQRLEVSASGDLAVFLPALSPLVSPWPTTQPSLLFCRWCVSIGLQALCSPCLGFLECVLVCTSQSLHSRPGLEEARTEAFLSLTSQPSHGLCLDFFFSCSI